MTKKIGLMALGLSMILLSGCGGSGGSTVSGDTGAGDTATVTGQFIDTYVEGLSYTCSSGATGVTNSDGEYTCNEGDTVEFSLGEYILGSATASSGVISPEILYPSNPEAALDVAQLLQTLDDDNDLSNGITVPNGYADLDAVTTRPGADRFDDDMETEIGEPLVHEDDAQAHMDETQLRLLFAGNTLYTTIWDDEGSLESWVFNANMTQATWTEIVGGDESGTVAVTGINGSRITIVDDEGTTVIEVQERLDDYLVVQVTGGDLGDEIETLRLYFNEANAREYLLAGPPTVDLITLLAGKTLYTTIWDDMGTMESWSFNDDMTVASWTEMVGGDANGRESIDDITGMTMTLTCTFDSDQACEEESTIIEVKEVLADYVVVEVRGGELGTEIETLRLYFDEAKAEEYFSTLGGGSSTSDLSALIVGETVYQKCGETVDSMTFQENGELVSVENGEEVTVSYRIEGNIVYTIEEDGENAHVFVGATADYIKFRETEGDITTFYFTSEAAQAAPPSDCGGGDEQPHN